MEKTTARLGLHSPNGGVKYYQVPAYQVAPHFVAHRPYRVFFVADTPTRDTTEDRKHRSWTLTHAPTGAAVAYDIPTLAICQDLAYRLLALPMPWSETSNPARKASREVTLAAQEIVADYRKEGVE